MNTLYKKIGNQIHYWSTLEMSTRKGYVYTGIVGKPEAEPQEIKTGFFSSFYKEMKVEAEKLLADGYTEELADKTLIIEYNDLDEEKYEEIKEKLEEFLLDSYLGNIDEDFTNEETFYCPVIDYPIAEKMIKEYLQKEGYGNYVRMYDLSTEPDDEV